MLSFNMLIKIGLNSLNERIIGANSGMLIKFLSIELDLFARFYIILDHMLSVI